MRSPTDLTQAYQWWRDALAGKKPPINHEPKLGWFKRRLVRGGPHVAARIWMHQEIESGELIGPEELRCEIDGKPRDPVSEWTYICYLPISESEYNFMTANAGWARKYAPGEPAANPERPVDYNALPLSF